MVVLRRVAVGLAVLVVLLVVADRVAVTVAERAVAREMRVQLALPQDPGVSIHGFPFLTQAIAGQYDNVSLAIPSIAAGPLPSVAVDANLQGVQAPLRTVVGGQLQEVPVHQITGSLTVGYAELARASGIPGLTISKSPNGPVQVNGSVQVLGQSIQATAQAAISVDNGDLVVSAQNVQINGIGAAPALAAAAARLLTFRVTPRGLPMALRITGVSTGPDSITVAVQTTGSVVLRRGQVLGTGSG